MQCLPPTIRLMRWHGRGPEIEDAQRSTPRPALLADCADDSECVRVGPEPERHDGLAIRSLRLTTHCQRLTGRASPAWSDAAAGEAA